MENPETQAHDNGDLKMTSLKSFSRTLCFPYLYAGW